MKKLLLSLLVLMTFAANASAQALTFKYEGETVESGKTFDIVSDINDMFEIQFDLHITNATANDMTIVCEMVDDPNSSTQNYICWGQCYQPGTFTAKHTLASGAEGIFNGHCMFADSEWNPLPAGTETHLVYHFYDERDPETKYTFNVNMKYETSTASQALTFKYEGETVESGTTFDIVSNINDMFEIQFDLHITNATENDMTIVCEMVDDPNSSTQNYICWGQCYQPGVYTATNTLAAGAEGIFNGHCMFANSNWEVLPVGTKASLVYHFYDERDPETRYTFNVNFTYDPSSIADFNDTEVFSNAFPNPAKNTVSFNYNLPFDVNFATVAIYNMMGQEVVKENLNIGDSRVDINVSDLTEGVYFYSLIINNQTVKTNKLVISK